MTPKAIIRHSPADRDAVAKRVLEECLASAIEEGGEGMIAAINLNIDQFNTFMVEGDDGEERKAA
jgi:hypothetical protein